jgi:hypothetical protein
MDRIPTTLLDEAEVSELECDNYDRIHGDTRYQEEQTVIPNQRQNRTVMCHHVTERKALMPPLPHSQFFSTLMNTLAGKEMLICLAVFIFGIGICFLIF